MSANTSKARLLHPRGSILIVTVVLMLLLMTVGAGLLLRGMKANEGVTQMQHYAASVSCADGARALLASQLKTYAGNTPYSLTQVSLGQQFLAGHYDSFGVTAAGQLSNAQLGNAGPQQGANGQNGHQQVTPVLFTVVCQDTSGQNRMTEIEYLAELGS